jgi:hypothetical protein
VVARREWSAFLSEESGMSCGNSLVFVCHHSSCRLEASGFKQQKLVSAVLCIVKQVPGRGPKVGCLQSMFTFDGRCNTEVFSEYCGIHSEYNVLVTIG